MNVMFNKELAKDILIGDGRLTSSVKEEYANKIVDAVYGNATNEELKALINECKELGIDPTPIFTSEGVGDAN